MGQVGEEQEEQEKEEEEEGELNMRELGVGRKETFGSALAPESIIHPHTFDAPFSIP